MIMNTTNRYGKIAIMLHWFMALLLLGMLCLGFYMTWLPVSPLKLKLYGWHKEWGVVIFFLAISRISWRLFNVNPTLDLLPNWERWSARTVHFLLYVLMLALPISGWLITGFAGLAVSFFGLFVIPNSVSPNENYQLLFGFIHEIFAYGLIILLFGHIAAAFKHHYINKDDILRRMLP